jgi:hypothetical protein
MTLYTIKLTRPATEVAIVEVEADSEVNAINAAFKEIDRLKDKPQDKRIKSVELMLYPDKDSPWEEASAEKT